VTVAAGVAEGLNRPPSVATDGDRGKAPHPRRPTQGGTMAAKKKAKRKTTKKKARAKKK
jgi:hypothetical protein